MQNSSEDRQSMQDAIKFTDKEIDWIQIEFAMILASKDQAEAHDSHDDVQVILHKNVNESINEKHRDQLVNKKIVISKAKDSLGKKASTLKPRLVASLLKLLMCKGGFTSTVPDPWNSFPQSRMEKVTLTFLCKFVVNYTFLSSILYVIFFSLSAA